MHFKRLLWYWSPVVLWMAFIFWMSTGAFSADNTASVIEPLLFYLFPSISSQQMETVHGALRKCGHLAEYFILGVLLFRAFRGGSVEPATPRSVLPALLVLLLYAAGDEFHQSFVETRTASLIDVGIDAAGGVLAVLACARRHAKRLSQEFD